MVYIQVPDLFLAVACIEMIPAGIRSGKPWASGCMRMFFLKLLITVSFLHKHILFPPFTPHGESGSWISCSVPRIPCLPVSKCLRYQSHASWLTLREAALPSRPGGGRDLPNFQFDPATKVKNVVDTEAGQQ
jgi:hypothetical protein